MEKLTKYETWYGRDEPPLDAVRLHAGRLSVEFQNGDLRYLRLGNQELVRRIYVAVRNVNWGTIPAQISEQAISAEGDRFRVSYRAYHEEGPVRFRWRAVMEGLPDGTIEYSLDGKAESNFRYNRLGFCVLHPIRGIAGFLYRADTPQGPISGVLPRLVEPQRIENGFEAPIFQSYSKLTIDLEGGIRLNTLFEGDLFEMEDQRNWTDGSFKTYSTPLSLGYPHQARSGQVFHQKITLWVDIPVGMDQTRDEAGSPIIGLRLGNPTGQLLPRLGFGIPSDQPTMSAAECSLISVLRPDHLKTEIHFRDPGWPALFDQAAAAARKIGSWLEIALFLEEDSGYDLEVLKMHLQDIPVARVIVFYEVEAASGTTSGKWIDLARCYLAEILPEALFVGGTHGNFAQLNRNRPEIKKLGGVCYPVNPQVHAWDERSLIEAIEAQKDTLLTAHGFCGDLPVSISSVTLKPPYNVVASEEAEPQDPNILPPTVDPRQMSLFGAAWTAGSIGAVAGGGADSVTYFETIGWKGLVESKDGSRLPDQFPSLPGMIFPIYWIFDFLAEVKQAEMLEFSPDDPLLCGGVALRKENRIRLLVANYQPMTQEVRLSCLPGSQVSIRRLNHETLEEAAFAPGNYRNEAALVEIYQGSLNLTLQPYETVFLEMNVEK